MPKDWHAAPFAIGRRIYIHFKEGGKWKQRRTGLLDTPENQIVARGIAAEMERIIKAREGLVSAAAGAGAVTLKRYMETWLEGREGTSKVDDEQRLRQYVLPVLGERPLGGISRPMVKALVRDLKKKPSRKGGLLAPRTVRNIYGALQALFADALNDGVVLFTPCTLRGKDLPAKRDKDSTFRDESIFDLPAVLDLVTSELVPWDRRVFNALLFLGCTRFGEASEARWKDYETALKPRPKLKVLRSYNTRHKLVKGTKAERPRHVPVVQLLAKILAEWKLRGFAQFFGRPPRPDDLIVPSRVLAADGSTRNRSANHMLRKFHKDLIRLKLTPIDEQGDAVGRERRQHDSRRTWWTTVVAEGASETHADWTAWGPPPEIWAKYTTMPWDTLCAVVDGLEAAIRRAQKGRKRA